MKTTNQLFGIVILTFGFLLQIQAQAPFTNGLVAYYPFNGNANDASGNSNNGSLVGSDRKFLPDRFGYTNSLWLNTTSTPAWNFDGAYVSAPRSAALDFNSDFTLSVWVNLSSGAGTTNLPENLISNGNDAGSINLRMIANASNFGGQDYLQFIWAGGLNHVSYAVFTPVREKWFQVTVVRSGTNVSLFKNGSFLTNSLTTGTANTSD